MSRFHDGDRVIVPTGKPYLPVGANIPCAYFLYATIRTSPRDNGHYAVVFDMDVGGHDCGPDFTDIEYGRGWWVSIRVADRDFDFDPNDIEEIPDEDFNLLFE